jgi:DNA-binding winged helix-turn-helix (wHTH) protein/TolB-like protein/Tfp pilus assembly protein PilF
MSAQIKHFYQFGPFCLDLERRLLLRDGAIVSLTPKVFETLVALVEQSGSVVSKDELLARLWPDTIVEERNLSQNIFLLRKALGDDLHGHLYIETVPKVGYRFLTRVTETEDADSTLIIETHDRLRIVASEEEILDQAAARLLQDCPQRKLTARSLTNTAKRRPRQIALVTLMALVCLCAGIGGLWFSGVTRSSGTTPKVRSIAVLPFKSLGGDQGEDYLGLGMADTLITSLGNINKLIVRPTSAVRKYVAADNDALAAGREQRVETVLEGSIQRAGDTIRLTVRLLDVKDGAALWSYKCDERCTDIFKVQDSISEKVAEALIFRLTGEERRLLTKHYTENTEAYQLYLKGRYFWNKRTGEGFRRALDYLNQAIKEDANYALAYVGLADSYTMLADYDWLPPAEAAAAAKAAAQRALALDDTLAEAHASLADIRRFYDWDWRGAEQEYGRAIELNPHYSTAHQWYAEFLSAMGRHGEAVREIERAEELDPLSVVVKSAAGWVFFFARDYDRAIAECQKVIEMEVSYGEVYSQLRRAYEQKGMYREALAADEKHRVFKRGDAPRQVELLDAAMVPNAKAYWQKILERTKKDVENKVEVARFRMVESYTQLGEKEQALKWLETAYQEHSFWMPFLNVHPHLDPLRAEPRFQILARQLGLPD